MEKSLKKAKEKYEEIYEMLDDDEITLSKANAMLRATDGIVKTYRENRLNNGVKVGKK